MRNPFPRRPVVWLAVALVLTVGTWWLFLSDRTPGTDAALRGFPLDDAWIHLVYARSLVLEGGFHYNPGIPETGMTSPLWVVLLAPVFAATRSAGPGAVVLGTKLLSLAFGLAGTVLMGLLALELGLGALVAGLAALLFAIDPSLTFSRAAGMEVPLFTMLVLAALVAALRGRTVAAGIAQGLAVVARPEGVVLFPVLAALLAHTESRAAVGRGRRIALALACACVPALLYAAFCMHATGSPLPNTFYAKFRAATPELGHNLALGVTDYIHGNLPYFTFEAGTLLAILGGIAIVREAGTRGAMTLAAFALLFFSTLASRGFAPGHYHYWERWLIPAFPGLLLAIAAGVGMLFRGGAAFRSPAASARQRTRGRRPDTAPAPRRSWAGIAAASIGVALLLAGVPRGLVERAHTFAWNCQNIDEVNVALGQWIDEHLPRDAVVAVNDAGALRYFGNRITLDLGGLNDHRVRRAVAEGRGMQLLVDSRVGWLVFFPSLFPGLVAAPGMEPVHEARSPHYTVSAAAQDVMVVYRWRPPRP